MGKFIQIIGEFIQIFEDNIISKIREEGPLLANQSRILVLFSQNGPSYQILDMKM
jgi:hypothetical protein